MPLDPAAQPERLSSRWTPYLRTIVPVASTVAAGAALLALAVGYLAPTAPGIVRGAAVPVWIAGSVWFFKWFGVLRDVWLDGDDILVDIGGRRVRVALREVTEIRQSHFQKTKTITLHLSRNTPLGARVRFVPRFALVARWADHPVARELRLRRERALDSGPAAGELRDPAPSP